MNRSNLRQANGEKESARSFAPSLLLSIMLAALMLCSCRTVSVPQLARRMTAVLVAVCQCLRPTSL